MAVSASVLMILENNPYPRDRRVYNEAMSLTRHGYQVSIICPRSQDQPWVETVEGVQVYRFPMFEAPGGALGYVWEYGIAFTAIALLSLRVWLRHGFDIIHAHNPPDIFGVLAAFYRLFGKRFVFDHHDLSPEMYDAKYGDDARATVRRLLLYFEGVSFRMAHHVIATNESYRQIALERGGVSPEQVTVVRNGPDLERLYLTDPDPELRAQAGTLLGYIGIMSDQDGVDYLIRAVHHLVADLEQTDVRCIIMGYGDAMPQLRTLTTSLQLDDYIVFTGPIYGDTLRRYLSTVDICVDPDPSNPYNDRSTMIKIMEYMTFGKPTAAFDLPEHRFTAENAALYAAANDPLDLAHKIAILIDDPDLRAFLGTNGRQRVIDVLAWPHQEKLLLKAYASLTPRSS